MKNWYQTFLKAAFFLSFLLIFSLKKTIAQNTVAAMKIQGTDIINTIHSYPKGAIVAQYQTGGSGTNFYINLSAYDSGNFYPINVSIDNSFHLNVPPTPPPAPASYVFSTLILKYNPTDASKFTAGTTYYLVPNFSQSATSPITDSIVYFISNTEPLMALENKGIPDLQTFLNKPLPEEINILNSIHKFLTNKGNLNPVPPKLIQ
jgi:hypothetical protein